jgi:hypothetical protein
VLEQSDYSRRRVERAAFETDRLLVVGDVTLPPEGYQSRFSDSLNRNELEFLPLTNCEVTSLADGKCRRQEFIALSKRHIRVAYPISTAQPVQQPAAQPAQQPVAQPAQEPIMREIAPQPAVPQTQTPQPQPVTTHFTPPRT